MIPFLGYAPDLDPTTAGVLKDVSNILPTTKGFKPVSSPASAGLSAVSAAANSLAVIEKLDATRRTFAGTASTLEEAGASGWTDQSKVAGYNCGSDSRWSFAQFGNYTLAANIGDPIQVSTASTFADISGSPQAAHIAVSDGFVMAANLSTNSDGWHCSAYLDHTDWTEAVSTQCTSGRLVGGGEITGLKKLGSGYVAFKKNATYLATYVGAPVVFQWDEIPGDVGCPTGNAAVDIGDRIAFLGHDDFYIFDGARSIPIGNGVREWVFQNADASYLHKTIATYNNVSGNVTWYFVSNSGSGNPDTGLVFNVRSGKWGKFSQTIEAAANYYPAGQTIDGLDSDYATIDDLPEIPFDSPYWFASTASAGIIKTDHILYTLTGAPGTSSVTMNTFGDDQLFSTVTMVRPRFLTAPATSTIDYSYDNEYGDSFTYKGTFNLRSGKYDLMHSSRWHQVKFDFTGNFEIVGAKVTVVPDGEE
jgi:hypothetical protein